MDTNPLHDWFPPEAVPWAILDACPALIYAKDCEGRFLLVNRAFETTFRITREQATGQIDRDLLTGNTAATCLASSTRVLTTGAPEEFEQSIPFDDGPRTYRCHAFPLQAPDGTAVAVATVALDITGWMKAEALPQGSSPDTPAEQARRAGEEMSRAVLASLPSQIAVLDKQGTIIAVNEAWNRFALENSKPASTPAGIGTNYLEVCERAYSNACSEAVPVRDGLKAVIDQSRTSFTLEYACHSPTQKRWFLLSAVPLRMDSGGAVVSHTDVTGRVLAEQKLQQSEEHYRALIENALDIVTILDPDGTIRYESPAIERVLGYQPNELIGRNAFDLVYPADLLRVREAMTHVMDTNAPSRAIEFTFRDKSGGWRCLEGIARNLVDNPAVGGIIVNTRDITARRRAEAEVREKEAALKRSHEQLQALTGRLLEAEERERRRLARELHDGLNQELAVLAVDMGTLARTLPDSPPGQAQQTLRALQTRLARACEGVRGMAHQLHPSILDDLGLIAALRSYCKEFERREGMEVRFVHRNVGGALAQEIASSVYRITQEGLHNVAKHANTPRVLVSLVGTTSSLTLKIRDFGAGFRPEAAKASHGLGLTSMEERARLIGGKLSITSRPGKGTTLRVSIPWNVLPD